MKHLKVFVFLLLLSVIVGCGGANLTTDKAQRAVDKSLDWTKKGGSAKVTGIREISQDNVAQADIKFDGFQYNADMMGTPISKDQKAPEKPDPNSPDFYSKLSNYGTEQVGAKTYTGQGTGTFKRYNDGRWVLTGVQFNFVSVNSTVEVE
jgi:hypothetical protein